MRRTRCKLTGIRIGQWNQTYADYRLRAILIGLTWPGLIR